MAENSKEMSVSFGEFSCRLSGFDDPLPVLTGVVEYFQKLAQDNPNFGTVPLSADADALGEFATAATGQEIAAANDAEGLTVSKVEESVEDADHSTGEFGISASEEDDEGNWEDFEVGNQSSTGFVDFDAPQGDEPSAETSDDEPVATPAGNLAALKLGTSDVVVEAVQPEEPAEVAVPLSSDEVGDIASEVTDPDLENLVAKSNAPGDAPHSSLDEEEAAIDRMLTKSRENGAGEPELAPANPLARLRESAAEAVDPAPVSVANKEAVKSTEAPLKLNPAPLLSVAGVAPLRLDPKPKVAEKAEASEPASVEKVEAFEDDSAPINFASDGFPDAQDALPSEITKPAFLLEPSDVEVAADEPDAGVLKLVPATPSAEASSERADDEGPTEIKEFAASMGASSLPELLEASAAYVTLVNGQSTFSRREIFDLFDTLNGENRVSFEARIKTLSRLLRTGVLERSEDGSFSMSRAARTQYEERASA